MTRDHRKAGSETSSSDDVSGFASPAGTRSPTDTDTGADTDPENDGDRDTDIGMDELPVVPFVPPPSNVADLASACVRYVQAKYSVPLDYTQDTLSVLDHYLREARQELGSRTEALEIIQSSAGAYFGEVLRRTFGGLWFAEGGEDGFRLDFTHVFLSVNPIGMVREALLLAPQDGWHAHLEMDPAARAEVQRRLALLPDVPDDEYYAPTTRFDVVALAFDALRGQLQAEGRGDVVYGERDYLR